MTRGYVQNKAARQTLAALQAELRQRRQDAAHEVRRYLEKRTSRPGYLSPQTREEFETCIADLEAGT